jgi:uncharacterized protein YqhQ
MKKNEKLNVGGQAVIEGVMMRTPSAFAIAVRKTGGEILIERDSHRSFTRRYRFLNWFFIRGTVILVESLILGLRALNFSANVFLDESQPSSKVNPRKRWNNFTLACSLAIGIGFGVMLFVILPLVMTQFLQSRILWVGGNNFTYSVVAGIFRIVIFLLYLIVISRFREMRRLFQYHGAEHKSVYTYENAEDLTLENARKYSTLHPRCGTAFLLTVMLVAILIFSLFSKDFPLGTKVLIRLAFIPVISGISYEIIKLADRKRGKKWAQILITPGLWLQRITTLPPNDSQIMVALTALRSVVDEQNDIEKAPSFRR